MVNKVFVIFGGNSGIGKEIYELCKEYNAIVYSFSRSNRCDISNQKDVRDSLKSVFNKNGHIDFVINTAGVLNKQSLVGMSYEDMKESLNINYWGAIVVAKESYEYLKHTHGGLLLYTSSSYTRGRCLYSLYSSSKAAIVNLVQGLSEEWGEIGIKINCINPERTRTPMRTKNFGLEPENSLLNPKSVAVASINTLFSNMTGQIIDVKR